MSRLLLPCAILVAFAFAACTGGDDGTATATGEATSEATGTAQTTGTAVATAAATDAAMTPQAIFAAVSPSIAFIETPAGTGSGMVISEE
ncbi:MAG: hypothetical protein O3A10_01150 [Chloroflexi bacterium]|nr:hypothetical protein [Chloroflexota bacterium]MDA1147232.1 hypothetical protein [Chloroflexota bacterium]